MIGKTAENFAYVEKKSFSLSFYELLIYSRKFLQNL